MTLGIDRGVAVPVAAWSLTTALGVILFAAFLRRPARREGVLALAGHAGASVPVSSAVATVPLPSASQIAGSFVASGEAQEDGDSVNQDEANLPRWLRPTLQEQRQSGGRGTLPVARQPARFESSARAGVERRTIGYRLVRVSDAPDDIRSKEVGRLDRGDEIEVIGEHEGFLQVRSPSGLEGWVPRVVIVG